MGATGLIAAKDLRQLFRSRTVLVLGVLAPLGLAFILNLVFGGVTDPDAEITFDVGLVDLDQGAQAEAFTVVVDGLADDGLLDVTTFDDEDAGRAGVDDGDVRAVWVLPAGMSDAVAAGEEAEIAVLGDVDAPTATSVARSIAEGFATRVGTTALAAEVGLASGAVAPEDVDAYIAEVAAAPPIARLEVDPAGGSDLDPTTSLTAGLGMFFLFFTAGLPITSLLEEREGGTLARLLVAPVPRASVVAAKVVSALVVGVVSLVTLMVASTVLMGADWGAPLGALMLAAAAVVSATGVMTLVGTAARTAEQAGSAQGLVAVAFGIAGGTFVPLAGTGALSVVQQLTPNGQFVAGLTSLRADGFIGVLPAVAVLVASGLATGAVGLVLSRRALR